MDAEVALPGEIAARLAALDSSIRRLDVRLDAFERESRTSLESLVAKVAAGFDEATARTLVMSEASDEVVTRQAEALQRLETAVGRVPTEKAAPVDLSRVHSALASLSTALGAIPTEVAPRVDLSGIESALASLSARVDAIPTESAPPADLSGVESAIAGFAAKLAPLQDTADAVAELKAVVAALAKSVASAQASIDAVLANPEPERVRAQIELVAERLAPLVGGPTAADLMDRQDDVERRLAAIETLLQGARIRPVLRAEEPAKDA